MVFMDLVEILKLLAPIIVIELGLKVYCLLKIKNEEPRLLSKGIWTAIVLLFSLLGPVAFLAFGRNKD